MCPKRKPVLGIWHSNILKSEGHQININHWDWQNVPNKAAHKLSKSVCEGEEWNSGCYKIKLVKVEGEKYKTKKRMKIFFQEFLYFIKDDTAEEKKKTGYF